MTKLYIVALAVSLAGGVFAQGAATEAKKADDKAATSTNCVSTADNAKSADNSACTTEKKAECSAKK